jgi:excisionase family DNA binding protein
MRISDERIEDLRRIYKEAYGEEIAVADARAMAHRLLALYRLLIQPLPGEEAQPFASQEGPNGETTSSVGRKTLVNREKRAIMKAPIRFFDNGKSTNSDPLLTIAEAARLFRISIPSMRRLQLRRFIPFVKVGHGVRFLKSDLATYLAKRRVESIE